MRKPNYRFERSIGGERQRIITAQAFKAACNVAVSVAVSNVIPITA